MRVEKDIMKNNHGFDSNSEPVSNSSVLTLECVNTDISISFKLY